MTQAERRNYLIRALISEQPRYRDLDLEIYRELLG